MSDDFMVNCPLIKKSANTFTIPLKAAGYEVMYR